MDSLPSFTLFILSWNFLLSFNLLSPPSLPYALPSFSISLLTGCGRVLGSRLSGRVQETVYIPAFSAHLGQSSVLNKLNFAMAPLLNNVFIQVSFNIKINKALSVVIEERSFSCPVSSLDSQCHFTCP